MSTWTHVKWHEVALNRIEKRGEAKGRETQTSRAATVGVTTMLLLGQLAVECCVHIFLHGCSGSILFDERLLDGCLESESRMHHHEALAGQDCSFDQYSRK